MDAASNLQNAIIDFWVQVATLLGYSRSAGEVFAVIFVSEEPLSADSVVELLHISRSGAGQVLKTLQEIGAISLAHQPNSRKEHFRVQPDLGVLVKQLLNARMFIPLEDLARKKQALADASESSGNSHLVQRFEKLQRWQDKASPVLTVLRALT